MCIRDSKCGYTVGLLATLFEVEPGIFVVDVVLGSDLDAANGIDDVDESAEADLYVIVDPDPGVRFDRLNEQFGASIGEGGVDLGPLIARYIDEGIAGNRHEEGRPAADVLS